MKTPFSKSDSDTIPTQKPYKWQIMLKILKLQNIQKVAPNFFTQSGGYSMEVKPYTDKNPNGLRRCIEDYLTNLGGYAIRVPEGLRIQFKGITAMVVLSGDKPRKGSKMASNSTTITPDSFPEFLEWAARAGIKQPTLFKN